MNEAYTDLKRSTFEETPGKELIQVTPEEAQKIASGNTRLAKLLRAAAIVHAARRVRARKDKRKARVRDRMAKASRKANR